MSTLVIPDAVWFLLIVWMALLALSGKDPIVGVFAGIVGIVFALIIATIFGAAVSLILILVNFYMLYRAILVQENPKK